MDSTQNTQTEKEKDDEFFKGVRLEPALTAEEQKAADQAAEANHNPLKDAMSFNDFVDMSRVIMLRKCPDATKAEMGAYYTAVVGENVNQTWAHPGAAKQALILLAESNRPLRNIERSKTDDNPVKPVSKTVNQDMFYQRAVPEPLDLNIRTLMNVHFLKIQEFLDHPLPSAAYSPIPYGSMKGKTDIDPIYVRQRMDECFGPQGIGWKIEPSQNAQYTAGTEQRTSKNGEITTWYTVRAENYVFKYLVVHTEGDQKTTEWISTSPISEYADNMDAGYCYRSVFSSLLKQAMKNMGGLNHVYMGIYTHIEAQKG